MYFQNSTFLGHNYRTVIIKEVYKLQLTAFFVLFIFGMIHEQKRMGSFKDQIGLSQILPEIWIYNHDHLAMRLFYT